MWMKANVLKLLVYGETVQTMEKKESIQRLEVNMVVVCVAAVVTMAKFDVRVTRTFWNILMKLQFGIQWD
jgi:hypothetical protein